MKCNNEKKNGRVRMPATVILLRSLVVVTPGLYGWNLTICQLFLPLQKLNQPTIGNFFK